MIIFDKTEIKNKLSIDFIFDLLQIWGGDPIFTEFGILSSTICHNPPGEGSKKLYFYENSGLFHCYTGCETPSFDIFELTIKVFDIQYKKTIDLNEAVRFIASKLGFSGRFSEVEEDDKSEDWSIFSDYNRIQNIEFTEKKVITLKEYDKDILTRFDYKLKLVPWLNEDISQQVIEYAEIGFYPGGDQITIPHFDLNDRFIGLRGRTLGKQEGETFGKYRPLKINKTLYNHPLGMNLYGLNWAKNQIPIIKKAIIFESEKSVLKYMSYFGIENNIAVACCGSNISEYQMSLLMDNGAEEIIIGLDRQFQEIGDSDFKKLKKNLLKTREKYKNFNNISFIFDKNRITDYKASPIDEGKEKFLQLYKERIVL